MQRLILKSTFLVVALFVVLWTSDHAKASGDFPTMMTSTTSVSSGTSTFYGGVTGSFAVFNPDPGSTYGFNKSKLEGCAIYSSTTLNPLCFFLGKGAAGADSVGSDARMMISQTKVNGNIVFETPALYFFGLNFNGDVSANLGYLLKYWGKNLNQGNDNQNGAAWNLGSGYGISHQAPIGWVYTDNTKFAEYRSKILTLAKEGQEVSAATGLFTAGTSTNIYLQGADLTDISNADQYKYPDGKVWVVKDDDLKVSSDITYHGVGTIIIYSKTPKSNDLQIIAGAKLRPANPATDRLGIIILDESTATRHACILGSGAEIRAQILCDGTTTVSGNLKFTGAISSWKFSISNPNSSINFAYDPSVAEIEPPGFRDLAIPNASEVGNR